MTPKRLLYALFVCLVWAILSFILFSVWASEMLVYSMILAMLLSAIIFIIYMYVAIRRFLAKT